MKTSTKILLIIYVVFTVGGFFLGASILEGVQITENSIMLNFDTLAVIGLTLMGITTILGFVLYARFLRSLSLSKGLFFSILPITVTFAILVYMVSSLNRYTTPSAVFAKSALMISSTNNNDILWSVLLFAAYAIFLFVNFIFMTKPLSRVQRATSRLGDGSVVDKKIELKGNRQFKEIEHSLNKINNNYKEKNNQLKQASIESEKYIPKQFLKFLGKNSISELELGHQVAREVTTMFCDIKNKKSVGQTLSLEENFNFVNSYLNIVSPIVKRYGGFVDKYFGEGILAVFSDAESSLECSNAIIKAMQVKNGSEKNKPNIDVCIGINTGEVMFGITGDEERKSPTIVSDAVNLAAKLEEINRLLGTTITFSKRTLNSLRTSYGINYRYIGSLVLEDKSDVLVFEYLDAYKKDKREKLCASKVRFEEGVRFYVNGDYKKAKTVFESLLKDAKNDEVAYVYFNKCAEKLKT